MNEIDDVKVKIGDQEIDARVQGVELENEFPEDRSPGSQPDRVKKNFRFSIEIEDISEELRNWIIWGEPDPEIQSTSFEEVPSGDEVEEVTIQGSVMENRVRDIIRDELPDSLTEESQEIPATEDDFVIKQIEAFQDQNEGDPTTGEVADIIGEPRDQTVNLLRELEARDVLESYDLGRSECWRPVQGDDEDGE